MKLRVLKVIHRTPDSVSLQFTKPDPEFKYLPGQHGIFNFTVNDKPVSRAYSFNSSPGQDGHLEITIRSVNDGLVSNHLLSNPPDLLDLVRVSGDFHLKPSDENRRHLLMFAGGSGITPVISMLRSVLYAEPQSPVLLVYVNRSFDRIIFRDELDALSTKYPERLKIYHVLTQSANTPEDYPIFYRDKLSKLILKKVIRNITAGLQGSVEYYTCGPHGLMQLLDETFQTLNVDKRKVYREHFYIPENRGENVDFANLPLQEIILQRNDEDTLLIVEGGKSILQAALANNISLSHSCTEGQCGVCRALLISGEVKLRKNHILTDDEIKSGQVLLCQGYPASDNVVVKPLNQP